MTIFEKGVIIFYSVLNIPLLSSNQWLFTTKNKADYVLSGWVSRSRYACWLQEGDADKKVGAKKGNLVLKSAGFY